MVFYDSITTGDSITPDDTMLLIDRSDGTNRGGAQCYSKSKAYTFDKFDLHYFNMPAECSQCKC